MQQRVTRFFLVFSLSLLVLVLQGVAPAINAAEENAAATITMLVGGATATTQTGEKRTLAKGGDIYAGDTLETGKKCYMKITYTDGGTMLLRPGTVLFIEKYRHEEDGGESAITLLKGGMRAVTGAISKDQKDNYKVNTPVATLGIRGTDFVMRLCQQEEGEETNDCGGEGEDGLYTTVYEGATLLTNDGGTLLTAAGQHAFVKALEISPKALATLPKVIAVDDLPNPKDTGQFIEGPGCG